MHLFGWLDAHARLRPDHPAVVDRAHGRTYTYRELRDAAMRQAASLLRLGLEPGDRVAVLSANRIEMLELLFGCARIGTIMVPMNFRLTEPELERILEDCTPSLLLVEAGRNVKTEVARLPIEGLSPASQDANVIAPLPDPEDPLLILYTGGTTGVPKGALLSQKTIQWNAWNTISGWSLSPSDVAPIFTPFFHTGGLNVLATPLLCLGATIVLPEGASFDPAVAAQVIEEERCTHVFMVPTMFQMLRDSDAFDADRFRTVKAFISGGAPCPAALFEAYWAQGLSLRQGYGLTEAGPNTFGASTEDACRRPGTVGTPLPHVRLRLERADGGEAEVGEVGELLIAGPHVTPGYWQRPVETAAVLSNGWLRTGDLARRDAEGFYYIAGRSKEMFISGGENVFPAEVEEVLTSHPEVVEAAVVGVPDAHWGEVGRAFVVARTEGLLDSESLIRYCQGRLARYKTPKEVCVVAALPRSATGKVLKRLLIEPSQN